MYLIHFKCTLGTLGTVGATFTLLRQIFKFYVFFQNSTIQSAFKRFKRSLLVQPSF